MAEKDPDQTIANMKKLKAKKQIIDKYEAGPRKVGRKEANCKQLAFEMHAVAANSERGRALLLPQKYPRRCLLMDVFTVKVCT